MMQNGGKVSEAPYLPRKHQPLYQSMEDLQPENTMSKKEERQLSKCERLRGVYCTRQLSDFGVPMYFGLTFFSNSGMDGKSSPCFPLSSTKPTTHSQGDHPNKKTAMYPCTKHREDDQPQLKSAKRAD